MGKINYGRVIRGGIVGGIVAGTLDCFFNGVLLGQQWVDAMKALNHPNAFTGSAFLIVLFLSFILGFILTVWMYAAIRPRFGAGVRTAVYVGLIAWAFARFLPNLGNVIIGGFFPRRLVVYSTLLEIVEFVVGAIVGAALYREAESTSVDYPVAVEARQTMR